VRRFNKLVLFCSENMPRENWIGEVARLV